MRYYIQDGSLIRALRKQAVFAHGRKVELAKVANQSLPLDGIEDPAGLYGGFLKDATEIIARLTHGKSR